MWPSRNYSIFTGLSVLESKSRSVVSDSLGPHGLILQARTLEWVAVLQGIFPNQGLEPRSPTLQADSLPAEPPEKPKNTRVGSLSLLQGILWIQESNQGLRHCSLILYQLSPRTLHNMSPHLTLSQMGRKSLKLWRTGCVVAIWEPCQPSDIIRTSLVLPRTNCSLLSSRQRWGLFTNTPTALL